MRFARNGDIPTTFRLPICPIFKKRRFSRRERLARRARIFQMAGDEKIQTSRPRFYGEISRLHALPRMQRRTARQEARDVKVGGKNLPEIVALSITDAQIFSTN
jgi:hypothetical protein